MEKTKLRRRCKDQGCQGLGGRGGRDAILSDATQVVRVIPPLRKPTGHTPRAATLVETTGFVGRWAIRAKSRAVTHGRKAERWAGAHSAPSTQSCQETKLLQKIQSSKRIRGNWLAQPKEHVTLDLQVVSSRPTLGVEIT